ncbi:MAG TPA: type II toxin-antitoxin system PemK/MazF family toxin [Micropepsaceae bacterium]|jgi:mRNA interferase MazF|nr:type II toxin-antitoxin system PemK/MazF family toxin [Micropepsaceae bacterium]
MKRGEIWTISGAGYSGKPHPAVIVQDGRFDSTASITVCPLTTTEIDAPFARLDIVPGEQTSLHSRSWIMVDKIVTVPKEKLGKRIGRLSDEDIVRLNRAILIFLGLA